MSNISILDDDFFRVKCKSAHPHTEFRLKNHRPCSICVERERSEFIFRKQILVLLNQRACDTVYDTYLLLHAFKLMRSNFHGNKRTNWYCLRFNLIHNWIGYKNRVLLRCYDARHSVKLVMLHAAYNWNHSFRFLLIWFYLGAQSEFLAINYFCFFFCFKFFFFYIQFSLGVWLLYYKFICSCLFLFLFHNIFVFSSV